MALALTETVLVSCLALGNEWVCSRWRRDRRTAGEGWHAGWTQVQATHQATLMLPQGHGRCGVWWFAGAAL